jgi:plasmid replication initiation protein
MYEILKQYEYLGERIITLEELRMMLGIEPHEYPRWIRFKDRVIDSCQKALEENTDIKFMYDPIRKGRKGIHAVKFIISKNADYVDQLTLGEFIDMQPEAVYVDDEEKEEGYEEHLRFIAGACDYTFVNAEM